MTRTLFCSFVSSECEGRVVFVRYRCQVCCRRDEGRGVPPCCSEPWRGGRPGRVGGRRFCSPVSGSRSSASVGARVRGQSGRLTAAPLPLLAEHEALAACSEPRSERSWSSALRSFRALRPLLVAAPTPGLLRGLVCRGSRSQRLSAAQSATLLLSLSRRRQPGCRTRHTWLLASSHPPGP